MSTPLEDIEVALAAAKAERYEMAARIEGLQEKVDTLSQSVGTAYGVVCGTLGWTEVADFVTKTELKPEMIRIYPGAKVLAESLAGVRASISRYPGVPIAWNTHIANRGFTAAQLVTFAKAIEVEAAKVPWLVVMPDAEPDRKDRPYSPTDFMAGFNALFDALSLWAPHAEIALNLTGYDFLNRINTYAPIFPLFKTLAIDPYWTGVANAVQGTEKDIDDAQAWCKAHGKQLAIGEYGASDGRHDLMADAMTCIRKHDIRFAPYFQEPTHGTNVPPTRIISPEGFSVYKAGAA